MEATLRWGPCDGDTVEVDADAAELRVPVACGVCLDELPASLSKEIYSEALYLLDPETGAWFYSGRLRYNREGNAYHHPG